MSKSKKSTMIKARVANFRSKKKEDLKSKDKEGRKLKYGSQRLLNSNITWIMKAPRLVPGKTTKTEPTFKAIDFRSNI